MIWDSKYRRRRQHLVRNFPHCLSHELNVLDPFWYSTAVSKNYQQDHRVGSVIGSTLTGLSTAWWKRNHNTHHVVPNSIEDDPNIQNLPLLAVSEEMIEKPYRSSYYDDKIFQLDKFGAAMVSYQHYIFLPLMTLARFNLYALGLQHLWNPKFQTNFTNTEIICIMGIFPIWYLSLANLLPTWGAMWAWIFLSHAVTALLHLQIVVSHWSRDTYRTEDPKLNKTANDDWYTLQLRTTMDIDCPAWLDWFHIGLQFQIVHHFFPTLPRPHLRAATQMVKEACRKNDIPFHSMGFIAMVGDSLRVLREIAELARTGKYTRNHLAEALRAEG